MPSEPSWPSPETAIAINQRLVQLTREQHFVRDHGLLESALARPQNAFAYGEEDVVVLAVRLLAGIAQAHAFEQGNKRTAFVAMVQFLNENGWDVAIEDSVAWAQAVIDLVDHQSSEDDFAALIRPFVVPRG